MKIFEKDKRLNISFSNNNLFDASLWKDIYGTHAKIGTKTYGDFPELKKVEDYLYEITINDTDEKYAYEELKRTLCGCTNARNGNFIIRSYDYYYDNYCQFIIKTEAKNTRHASIGVACCDITDQQVTNNEYSELLKLLPYRTVDGINDCGVYCSMNVVPTGDKGLTTGTKANAKDLPNLSIARFILDNANTAKDAINKLKGRNVFAIKAHDEIEELHVFIADKENTFIIEFIDNKMVVLDEQTLPNNLQCMTNFYLSGWNGEYKTGYVGNTKEEIDATGITAHAQGLERYNVVKDNISTVIDFDSGFELLNKLRYTNLYRESTEPYWYSELSAIVPHINIYNTKDDFKPIKDIACTILNTRLRDEGNTWHSTSQCVYDLENKKFRIRVQENNQVYEYSL